jgi:hypothetical protein
MIIFVPFFAPYLLISPSVIIIEVDVKHGVGVVEGGGHAFSTTKQPKVGKVVGGAVQPCGVDTV